MGGRTNTNTGKHVYVAVMVLNITAAMIANYKQMNKPSCFSNITKVFVNDCHLYLNVLYINGLVQERHTSSASAMGSRLSCKNPLMYMIWCFLYRSDVNFLFFYTNIDHSNLSTWSEVFLFCHLWGAYTIQLFYIYISHRNKNLCMLYWFSLTYCCQIHNDTIHTLSVTTRHCMKAIRPATMTSGMRCLKHSNWDRSRFRTIHDFFVMQFVMESLHSWYFFYHDM